MEREERELKQTCEELRKTLKTRTRELEQSQELYTKLKHRVLRGDQQQPQQQQPIPPTAPSSSTPFQTSNSPGLGQGHAQVSFSPPLFSGGIHATSNGFPTSPRNTRPEPSSTALLGRNKSALPQRKYCLENNILISKLCRTVLTDQAGRLEAPSNPSHHLSMRSASAFAFASTPQTGIGTASVPGSGRNRETPSHPETQLADGTDGHSTAKTEIFSRRTIMHGPTSLALARPSSDNQSGV
jgi:hypothetical protein